MKYSILNITVPDIKRTYVKKNVINFSSPEVIASNIDMLSTISLKYGPFVEKWANLFELDNSLVYAFIATESAGINRKAKPNYGPTGIMQIAVNPVAEAVYKYKQITKNSLPIEVTNYFNKKASFLTNMDSDILSASNKSKVSALLVNEEFNVICGCLILRWLIQKFKYLNKVIVAYNSGAYASVLANYNGREVSTATLISDPEIKSESAGYLLKMLGVNGFLELIIKNKL